MRFNSFLRSFIVCGVALLMIHPECAEANDIAQRATNDIYECGQAMDWGKQMAGQRYQIDSKVVWDHLDSEIRSKGTHIGDAADAVKVMWKKKRAKDGASNLRSYILAKASACDKQYASIASAKASLASNASGQPTLAGSKRLNAPALKYYLQQTEDYTGVADYIVALMPNGKNLMGDSPEGDLLGEMIAERGAKGAKVFSDAVIVATLNRRYWQYNPPASIIVENEYRRRMRALKYSQDQARRMVQREEEERLERERRANAKPVGSLGKHCEKQYEPGSLGIPGAWVTRCW